MQHFELYFFHTLLWCSEIYSYLVSMAVEFMFENDSSINDNSVEL